ncbi:MULTISPECIES: hypothetical protein [unclassified Nocardiopsis]|uniref:hypothetical protein n=1 Tax=unclassified Nocardiopsis TaxID=2649073 RepID=UPI00066BBBD4|nr:MULTISPECIES: hypothetical protein [unclassified Nocardiopsis]MBQ1082638.1 hypothetical protein [Nocardiopsis sp. B62]
MNGHTTTRRWGTLVVPLVAVVVLCFLCALCYPGEGSPGEAGSRVSTEWSAASDPAEDSGSSHVCPTPDERGLLTAQPMLALGSALVLCVPALPRVGPSPRRTRGDPAGPHGHRLLTLLCVQRV